jgi:hypothetical protein
MAALASGSIVACNQCGADVDFNTTHRLEIQDKEISLCESCCPFCFKDEKPKLITADRYVTCRLNT